MTKILWIDLNSSYAHSSLALPALHAQLKDHPDYEWDVVSATINENVGAVADAVARRRPDVVAATLWLFNHEALMHIAARVKALLPEAVLILGGPELLGDNEAFLRRNPWVDCVFRGEGEEEFPKWLECYRQPEQWPHITGLCYLDAEGRYRDHGRAQASDFTQLTPPEESRFFPWGKPFVQLETTRGCFNTCAFCVSGGEKPVRTLSIEAIRTRLQLIHSYGIKDVRVLDRTFNYNARRAQELLELFREFHPHMRFHLEIHPALLTEALKAELQQLPQGLLHLEAGIQSLREPVLTACRRMGKLSDALDGLRFLCSLDNMVTHADLIAGLPHYRLMEIIEDIHTLAEYRAGEIQLESLKLLPGTEMRRRADEWGIRYAPLPPYEVLQTDAISTSELQFARGLSRLLDAFYNTEAWQELTRSLLLDNEYFLMQFLVYLTKGGLINQPLSLERRGLELYKYCKRFYPHFVTAASIAWIEAGMSLKKAPAERVKTKHQTPPEQWEVVRGTYKESLRLCFLPTDADGKHGWWFGFETEKQQITPVFKAKS